MEVKRVRPIKQFEVLVAHGPYSKGARIQPTGLYRDMLLRRGIIRELTEDAQLGANRMMPDPQSELRLMNRSKRGRG